MDFLELAPPAVVVVLSLICIGLFHWNAVVSALLCAGIGCGVSYAQSILCSGKKCSKQAPAPAPEAKKPAPAPAPAPAPVEEKPAPAPAPAAAEENPQFKEGEEPEHFHDNDELAAKANVHRDNARRLRDEAHAPENKERKGELLDQANEEDAMASKMIFEELQKKQPEGTIDLHLQFVAEAVRICDEQATLLKGKGAQEMVIITGKGNHSEGGKCKIAPAVEEWAAKNNLPLEHGEGKVTVKL